MNEEISIGGVPVGPSHSPFVIAEIGINHNGSVALAKSLIEMAHRCGCHAVKFQKRTVPVIYTPEELAKSRPVPRFIIEDALKRGVLPKESVKRLKDSNLENTTNGDLKWLLEFTKDEYEEIDSYCKSLGIIWFASCWDEESVDFIGRFNQPCYKIASPCLTDDNLLTHTAKRGRPVILSTGMSTLPMVLHAVSVLERGGCQDIALMHCVSVYQSDTSEMMLQRINLRAIQTLQKAFSYPVGFSSHHNGIVPTHSAVALGANLVEHHITDNNARFGSDQAFSLVEKGLTELCRWIREFPPTLGSGEIDIDPDEESAMKKLRRVWSSDQQKIYTAGKRAQHE